MLDRRFGRERLANFDEGEVMLDRRFGRERLANFDEGEVRLDRRMNSAVSLTACVSPG